MAFYDNWQNKKYIIKRAEDFKLEKPARCREELNAE